MEISLFRRKRRRLQFVLQRFYIHIIWISNIPYTKLWKNYGCLCLISFSQALYTVRCLSKLYEYKTSVKQTVNVFCNKATSQIGNVRARVFNAGLLTRSQFASGRSCDRPTRSRYSVVFLGPRANAELVPKFHVALLVSHAALKNINF
jgi:hypothetical protein